MQWWVIGGVALGGAAGSLLRYGVTLWAAERFGGAFPWGTLLVNLAGCFLYGAIWSAAEEWKLLSPALRVTLLTGFLGGLTTFSSFGFDCTSMLVKKDPTSFLVNVGLQMVGGCTAVWLGWTLVDVWRRGE